MTRVKQIKNELFNRNFGSLLCGIAVSILIAGSQTALAADKDTPELFAKAKVDPDLKYQVSFKPKPKNQFYLTADYRHFPEKADAKHMGGVIVLHDCKASRKKYKSLTVSLAEQGLHTLTLDFRGYGTSVAPGFSHKEIKKHSNNIVAYQNEMAVLSSYWADDLLAAFNFLRTKVDKSKRISVVASGCSGAYAITLAEKVQLRSLVLLTPEMTFGDRERYKNLIDIPTYFISSAQHAVTYSAIQELFDWNGSERSKMQVLKGDRLDAQLLRSNKYLVNDIALWLKQTLR